MAKTDEELVGRLREPFERFDSIQFDTCRAIMKEAAARIEQLAKEREQDRKDAERYRWLRGIVETHDESKFGGGWVVKLCECWPCDPPSVSPLSDAEQLDAAIDSAMQPPNEGEK